MTIERRHDRRYVFDRPIKVQCDQTGLRYLSGQMVNFSAGGAMIEVEHPSHLQLGQEVKVAVARGPREALLAAEDALTGTVVRSLGCADTQHLAVRFHKPHRLAQAC